MEGELLAVLALVVVHLVGVAVLVGLLLEEPSTGAGCSAVPAAATTVARTAIPVPVRRRGPTPAPRTSALRGPAGCATGAAVNGAPAREPGRAPARTPGRLTARSVAFLGLLAGCLPRARLPAGLGARRRELGLDVPRWSGFCRRCSRNGDGLLRPAGERSAWPRSKSA